MEMTTSTGRLYVIGDKDTGVLFVKTDPLRAAIIPKSAIEQYASERGFTYAAAFARVAEGAKKMIIQADGSDVPADVEEVYEALGALVEAGTVITDAEFCFIAEVENSDWSARRYSSPPIERALAILGPDTQTPNSDLLPEAPLRDA